MGLEHLFSELLVATVLDGVDFETVRVGVHVVVLCEQVRDRVESSDEAEGQPDGDLLVGDLALSEVGQVLRHIMGHLGSRGGGAIFIFNHAVVELRGHGDDHVIIVGVEVAALGNVETEGSVVVVTCQQVVRVVNQTWLMSVSLGELRRPHTIVGVLGLMNGEVGSPDSIMDHTLSEVPLLEVIASVLLVGGVDLGSENHAVHELSLLETLVYQEIVLLMHGTVAALARPLEDLEAASQTINTLIIITLTWQSSRCSR
jgi:hypothetical protein